MTTSENRTKPKKNVYEFPGKGVSSNYHMLWIYDT